MAAVSGEQPTYSPPMAPPSPPIVPDEPLFELGLPAHRTDKVMRSGSDICMDSAPQLGWQRSRTPRGAFSSRQCRFDRGDEDESRVVDVQGTFEVQQEVAMTTAEAGTTSGDASSVAVQNLQPDFVDAILASDDLLTYHSEVIHRSYRSNECEGVTAAQLKDFFPRVYKQAELAEPPVGLLLEQFAIADADKDGVLNAAEFKVFIQHALEKVKQLRDLDDV